MYDSDPFQGLPTRLDAFGRRVVDESRLAPSQWIQWKQAQPDRPDLASNPN